MAIATASATTERASEATRWGQLIFGIICMVMIANLQYGWTLFVTPIDQKYHWGRAAIQVAFTIFVLTETWLVPIEGWFIDKFGPRIMISVSGALVALAWFINSIADSLFLLYVGAAIGGIGAGVIYGGSVGNALKWFPDRRGLAAGLTAAGFGAVSALTIIPIAGMIKSSGYESAVLWFGLGQGIVIILVTLPAVLRLGVGPDRSREHDVHRIPRRGHRHLCAVHAGSQPAVVRVAVRSGVLRLGRDLFAVPGDLHRHLRPQISHN